MTTTAGFPNGISIQNKEYGTDGHQWRKSDFKKVRSLASKGG
jgi:hypothetical protein